jgi:two-component system, NtrC family, sensor kinase
MKRLFTLLIFSLLVFKGRCQKDNSANLIPNDTLDINQVSKLWYQGEIHLVNAPDSALIYAQRGLALAKQIKFSYGEEWCLRTIAKVFMNIGNYSKSLEFAFQALNISEQNNDQSDITINLYFIGEVFGMQGDYRQALSYNFRAKSMTDTTATADTTHDNARTLIELLLNIGSDYKQLNQIDSALFYAQQGYALCNHNFAGFQIGKAANLIGDIYSKSENLKLAMYFYRLGISYSDTVKDNVRISNAFLGIAQVFKKENKSDSCLYYSKLSLSLAQNGKFRLQVLNASNFLADYYKEKKVFDSAFAYQQLSINAKDSLFGLQKIMEFQNISFSEQMRQQEIKDAELRYRNRVSIYILFGAVATFLFIAIILWRNNRQKQKANALLNKQNQEIEIQKIKVETALQELQSTQAQLVQAEKMASLGELTAGIAHEIQNPLNFVNNFSEVNTELSEELEHEAEKGNIDEIKMIAKDIKENSEKINQHGKRADAIVKGMLQHSRLSTGVKDAADINKLADEYLRLSYHGLRAKNKEFKATMQTNFDESIGKINIIPQDVGRVLLNLYNNAFYAVNEKNKTEHTGYEPTVSVSTKNAGNKIFISVKDNGNGISKKIFEKIFQPFFTTKPTGQGTGLGLSLSYDIIKAHRGEIKVETKEGEGSEFIIELPLK